MESKTVKVGAHLNGPEDLTAFPEFPEGTTSLLSKYLTLEIWEELKDKKDAHGFSFKQAIFSGCKWTKSNVGVYAGSRDSYYAFNPFMDKIIESYHGHKPTAKHVSNLDYTQLKAMEFTKEEGAMINSTRIRVARNLAGYPLGTQVTAEQRQQIEAAVIKALNNLEGDLKGTYYSLVNMDEKIRLQLIEDHLLFKSGDKYLQSCGLERDWPKCRGIFYNPAKTFIVWVNEEDELRVISMQNDYNIKQVFERLSRALTQLDKELKFDYDDHIGFTSTCPTNLGTGMRASVHIKLPKLQHKPDLLESIADKYHVQIRGVHGEHTTSEDGTFDISNLRRLGIAELDLIQDMYDGVKAMIKAENEL